MDKVKTEGEDGTMKVDKDSSVDFKKRRCFNFREQQASWTPAAAKFEGKCDELKGNGYGCSDMKQADIFAKTTKETAGFVGRTYNYGGDIQLVVENLKMVNIAMPKDPPKDSTHVDENLGKGSGRVCDEVNIRQGENQDTIVLCAGTMHGCNATGTRWRPWTHLRQC